MLNVTPRQTVLRLGGLGMAFCDVCSSSTAAKCRCRKELDSPWSWLVCFSATFIIVLTLGISLNFGVLFPVLMDYFQESRERIGKFISCWSIDNLTYFDGFDCKDKMNMGKAIFVSLLESRYLIKGGEKFINLKCRRTICMYRKKRKR